MDGTTQHAISNVPTDVIVGIDLGTTNSVVAVVIDGKPQVLVESGESILPSVVGFDADGTLVTGLVARNQLAAFPERTIASIKRKMGTMDPVKLGEQSFTPPEISAMILRRLRERASRILGVPVERAVITVPAFFDENQRQATREAGQLAGFKVERIINEPTAAALVYHVADDQQRHIAVYDFGGGTFDVSILRMENGVTEVLCSKGDTHLGGDDLDLALAKHLSDEFCQRHGVDLLSDPNSRFRLLQACERAKCELSSNADALIDEPFIAEVNGQPLNLSKRVTRGEFEDLIKPFVQRTINCINEAFRDVNLMTNQVDDVVLVGGTTRIPMVQRILREEFLREPNRSVDPDLAVALGASVQAATQAGQDVGPVLVDVSTHTLGIAALTWNKGYETVSFCPVLHRNSPLPAKFEDNFSTTHPSQKKIQIEVYQGEHPDLSFNTLIGNFEMEVTPGEDNSRIVVRFALTLDGTLKVTAIQTATRRQQELTINNALSKFKSEDRPAVESRLAEIFQASPELHSDDSQSFGEAWGEESSSSVESDFVQKYPVAAELLTRIDQLPVQADSVDAAELQQTADKLRQAMADDDADQVNALTEELDDILFYIR